MYILELIFNGKCSVCVTLCKMFTGLVKSTSLKDLYFLCLYLPFSLILAIISSLSLSVALLLLIIRHTSEVRLTVFLLFFFFLLESHIRRMSAQRNEWDIIVGGG